MSTLFDEWANQTGLGLYFGVSSHVIGRWLAELKLRVVHGNPTMLARSLGLVTKAARGQGRHGTYYVWHRQRTILLLEQAGHKPVDVPDEFRWLKFDGALTGPFDLLPVGDESYVIRNCQGRSCGCYENRETAAKIALLLNLAHEKGYLQTLQV